MYWDKHHSRKSSPAQNRYLSVLIDAGFQGVNRIFVSSFEGDDGRKSCKQYCPPTVEKKDYNIVMIDGINVFSQPVKIDLTT